MFRTHPTTQHMVAVAIRDACQGREYSVTPDFHNGTITMTIYEDGVSFIVFSCDTDMWRYLMRFFPPDTGLEVTDSDDDSA